MGYIDTLASLSGVSHKVLLNTSQYTKIVNAPTFISLRQIDDPPIQDEYFNGFRPVAVLLEGEFQSVFTNRPVNDYKLSSDKSFSIRSKRTSMIVVSDGDLIRNEVSWRGTQPEPVPLGYDRFVNETYGNKEFIMNAIHYLADDGGLMQLRTRELRLRLLDKARLLQEHKKWKWINILFPPLLVLIAAIAIRFRKRLRYGSVS
jgi:ABC-2 type transport system permease protein